MALEKFTLADEIDLARGAVQKSIAEALVAALPTIPIFHGKP